MPLEIAHPAQGGEPPRTFLLLGASSDIGVEVIQRLPSGCRILAHYNRSPGKLEALRQLLPRLDLVPLQADLSSGEDVAQLIRRVGDQCSALDGIVHLAAPKFQYVRFKDASWDLFRRELDVQLGSLVRVLQSLLPGMGQRKRGKVVLVLSSVTVGVPPGALTHYITTKFALWGLARALAAEYSSRRININAVSPSMVETAFLEKLPPRMVELAASASPWQRNATSGDVAGVICFLLSAEADYLTGANIPISGGSTF